jgi:hypothetical protein
MKQITFEPSKVALEHFEVYYGEEYYENLLSSIDYRLNKFPIDEGGDVYIQWNLFDGRRVAVCFKEADNVWEDFIELPIDFDEDNQMMFKEFEMSIVITVKEWLNKKRGQLSLNLSL